MRSTRSLLYPPTPARTRRRVSFGRMTDLAARLRTFIIVASLLWLGVAEASGQSDLRQSAGGRAKDLRAQVDGDAACRSARRTLLAAAQSGQVVLLENGVRQSARATADYVNAMGCSAAMDAASSLLGWTPPSSESDAASADRTSAAAAAAAAAAQAKKAKKAMGIGSDAAKIAQTGKGGKASTAYGGVDPIEMAGKSFDTFGAGTFDSVPSYVRDVIGPALQEMIEGDRDREQSGRRSGPPPGNLGVPDLRPDLTSPPPRAMSPSSPPPPTSGDSGGVAPGAGAHEGQTEPELPSEWSESEQLDREREEIEQFKSELERIQQTIAEALASDDPGTVAEAARLLAMMSAWIDIAEEDLAAREHQAGRTAASRPTISNDTLTQMYAALGEARPPVFQSDIDIPFDGGRSLGLDITDLQIASSQFIQDEFGIENIMRNINPGPADVLAQVANTTKTVAGWLGGGPIGGFLSSVIPDVEVTPDGLLAIGTPGAKEALGGAVALGGPLAPRVRPFVEGAGRVEDGIELAGAAFSPISQARREVAAAEIGLAVSAFEAERGSLSRDRQRVLDAVRSGEMNLSSPQVRDTLRYIDGRLRDLAVFQAVLTRTAEERGIQWQPQPLPDRVIPPSGNIQIRP